MQDFRIFQVKYIPATNNKKSRIKFTDTRFQKAVYIRYDNSFRDMREQAENFFADKGIPITGIGYDEIRGIYIFCSTDFETSLK